MSEIVIDSDEKMMQLVFKLTRFEMQYPEFAKQKAEYLVNTKIVDVIREKMQAKGYSKKISERVRAEFVGFDPSGIIEFDIISDFETNDVDVAVIMEEGRRRFWDGPVRKKALSWIKEGLRFFSFGHYIPERPGDKFVDKTIAQWEQDIQDILDDETDQFLDRQLVD